MHSKRIHPRAAGALGVAHRDVAGDAFVESKAREQTKGASEADLAMAALLLGSSKGGRRRQTPAASRRFSDSSFGHTVRIILCGAANPGCSRLSAGLSPAYVHARELSRDQPCPLPSPATCNRDSGPNSVSPTKLGRVKQ